MQVIVTPRAGARLRLLQLSPIVGRRCLVVLALLAFSLKICWGQNGGTPSSSQPAEETTGQTTAEDPSKPATEEPGEKTPDDQADTAATTDETPKPGLGPLTTEAPREKQSFLLMSVAAGESAQWDPSLSWSTQVVGDADLVKFWSHSVTSVNYTGGAFIYQSNYPQQVTQIQELTAAHRFLGRTRQFTILDSVGDSNAGGTFGSSIFGGGLFDQIFADTGVSGGSSPGLSLFSTGDIFGEVGVGSQITNVVQATLTQKLKTRSSITLLGGYGINTYYGSSAGLISSQAYSAAIQYTYQIGGRSSVGLLYGHRIFDYPLQPNVDFSVRNLTTNDVLASYQRTISHRLSFGGGAGPSFDQIGSELVYQVSAKSNPTYLVNTTNQVSLTAYGGLSYALKNGSAALSYQRAATGGSGIFAGATTDLATASYGRTVFRRWGASFSTGYARIKQLQQGSGLSTDSLYQTWYAGATVSKSLGRDFGLYATYQFADESTANSVCQVNRCVSLQHVATVGISWHARPIRLDGDNPMHRSNPNTDPDSGSADSGDKPNSK